VSKARLFHLAVVCSLIAFALVTALQMLPDGFYDGAD
jgi:hypothetical protein